MYWMAVPIPQGERAMFWGKSGSPLWSIITLYRQLCKDSWTNWDAFSDEHLVGPNEPNFVWGPDPPMGRNTFEGVCPIGNHYNSELCNTSWMLTFVQYTNGKLLPSAIYRSSLLEDRHLHLGEISDLKLIFPIEAASCMRRMAWRQRRHASTNRRQCA